MEKSVWPVLVASTFGVLVGHWLVVGGILLGEGDADGGFEPVLVGIGLAVLAATVVTSAVATGRSLPAGFGAAAVGAVVTIAVWMLRSDEVPLPALTAGLAVSATLAIARTPRHDLRIRLFMAVAIVAYMVWVTDFSGAFAILVAPLLPYPTVGVSDFASERGASHRMAHGYAARK